jgi:hypothetical protein
MFEELINIAKEINSLSGSLVIFIILVGGSKRFRLWVFAWVFDERVAEWRERWEYERREKEALRDLLYKASGIVETLSETKKAG